MWIKRLVMVAISSGLAASALQLFVEKRRLQRMQREKRLQREAVQRWEDEGGSPQPQ